MAEPFWRYWVWAAASAVPIGLGNIIIHKLLRRKKITRNDVLTRWDMNNRKPNVEIWDGWAKGSRRPSSLYDFNGQTR